MKYFSFVLMCSFLLFGCGIDDPGVPVNEKLENLKTVLGKESYQYHSKLQCSILTGTLESVVGEKFHLKGLDSPVPTISFESDDYRSIRMDVVGQGQALRGFGIVSTIYGQSYLLLNVETGVFNLSSLDFMYTLEKQTFKGNCLPLEDGSV